VLTEIAREHSLALADRWRHKSPHQRRLPSSGAPAGATSHMPLFLTEASQVQATVIYIIIPGKSQLLQNAMLFQPYGLHSLGNSHGLCAQVQKRPASILPGEAPSSTRGLQPGMRDYNDLRGEIMDNTWRLCSVRLYKAIWSYSAELHHAGHAGILIDTMH
jgi:hypothetical protein